MQYVHFIEGIHNMVAKGAPDRKASELTSRVNSQASELTLPCCESGEQFFPCCVSNEHHSGINSGQALDKLRVNSQKKA